MVVHRLPGELEAEVPTSVYALDLQRLSQLLGIDEEELVSGFHAHPTLSEMHGVIVEAGEDVPFEAIEKRSPDSSEHAREATFRHDSPLRSSFVSTNELPPVLPIHLSTPPPSALPTHDRRLCKQALITAATRTTSLDVDGPPKCLIHLGSQTIISHILTQLYAAGIERIVISVAESGRQIMDAVKQTSFYSKMVIEFMDLGEDNKDGHARSILAAREYFKHGPFLIHTSDHIFDKTIITKFMNYQLNENVTCVLVETDVRELVGLPSTTVKVQLGREKIRRIGRDVLQYDGIDAGLFLSSTAIFDALEELTTKKSYFSLADALSYFTKYNKLTYIATAGETWFSIETQEQLAFTQDHEGERVLSPWTVFLATVPPQQSVQQKINSSKHPQNLVIGISAVDRDASLRVVGANDPKKLFDGFIVGVTNADRRDEEMLAISSGTPDGRNDESLFPLLANRAQSFVSSSKGAGSTRSMLLSRDSFIEPGNVEESFVISFPVGDEMSETIDNLSSSQYAYLIEMNPDPTTPAGTNGQFMLAVPGTPAMKTTPKTRSSHSTPILEGLRRRDLLPSDIEHISLETRGYDEHLEVSVVVTRKVPLIGYVLLGTALLTISSVAVALDMEANVPPLLKLFWRNCGTSMVTFPLAVYSIRRNGGPEVSMNLIFSMILAGAAYGFYLGAYVVSLSLTTVAHSTLFNNAHSLIIVMFKLVTGQPVQLLEGVGTAIGLMGGVVTTMDVPAKVEASEMIGPSVFGDLVALLGAAGGATYFIVAKKLRPKMDLIVFMCCLTAVSAVCLFLTLIATGQKVTLSTDENHGVFGWINPTPTRLLLACYLVFICDLCGNMGYISVMKYFDPLVVSVVCLLEPIIADVLAILLGFDTIPGLLTFVGGGLVIGGTFLVIKTQSRKTEQHDATEAIKSAVSQSGIGGMTPQPLYSARTHRSKHAYGSLN